MDQVRRYQAFQTGFVKFETRQGQGFIVVYSIASRTSFDRVAIFIESIFRMKRPKPVFILVGNMCDKINQRKVYKEEGQSLARSVGCAFIETSAKTAHNVEYVFASLIRALRSAKHQKEPKEQKQKWTKKCVMF